MKTTATTDQINKQNITPKATECKLKLHISHEKNQYIPFFSQNVRQLYALVCESLKYQPVLTTIFKGCHSLQGEETFKEHPHMATVLLYEHLVGKGLGRAGRVRVSKGNCSVIIIIIITIIIKIMMIMMTVITIMVFIIIIIIFFK